jgi:uncharacterized protein (TIGR00251 family)
MKLKVKVVPGASRSSIVGWLEDCLKVRVSEQPERGKANDAVLKLLSVRLGLPATAISLVSGAHSSRKVFQISTISKIELLAAIGKPEGKPNEPI